MKNLLLLFFLLPALVSAQDSDNSKKKDLKFDNESKKSEIKIKVNGDSKSLVFTFKGTVSKGDLNISLIDPEGKREGGFNLSTVRGSKGSGSSINITTNNKDGNAKSSVNIGSAASSSTGTSTSTNVNINSNSNSENGKGYNQVMTTSYSGNGKGESKGSMTKTISNPLGGTWIVKIETKKATGKLSYRIIQ